MTRYIYLPVEIKAREFWPKVWLARILAEHGFTCIVGDKVGVGVARMAYPSGIYFEKSISAHKVQHIERLRRWFSAIVCQDEEAGIARDDLGPFFDERACESTLSRVDRFFCWGEQDCRILQGRYPQMVDRLKVTGSARSDLWRSELAASLFAEELEEIRTAYGRFVLVNSSLGITSRDRVAETVEQSRRYRGLDDEQVRQERERLEARYQEFRWFARQIDAIAERRPDIRFVLRPHPAEPVADWQAVLHERDNLRIVKRGDAGPWIHAAACVVHEGCTTAVQAACMGRPIISLVGSPCPATEKRNSFPLLLGVRVASIEEFSAALDTSLAADHDRVRKNDLDVLRGRIANVDGDFAARRIATGLDEIAVNGGERHGPFRRWLVRHGSTLRVLLRSARWLLAATVGGRFRRRFDKLAGGIDAKQARRLITRMEASGVVLGTCRVSPVGFNTIMIRPDRESETRDRQGE